MSVTSIVEGRPTYFQIKTSFSPCTILQLLRYDLSELQQQLSETIRRAPNFFLGSPVLIDLEKIHSVEFINFAEIKKILSANGVTPIGVRGGTETQHALAATQGLPALNIGKLSQVETQNKKTAEQKPQTKMVTTPIRSGMQVYAKDADLVVTAPVSAGAELLSDGNIHIYGPLRGRALAGIQGNTNARIFCRDLQAELISIAGYYLTKEDMQTMTENHDMIQIYLDNEHIRIEAIT